MKKLFLYILCIAIFQPINAQKPETLTSSEIYFKMEQLNVLASALYIAAHPDDENTHLITYLTHHEKAYTEYLSLTRGNGGQNLISNELGTDLGVIRTNELWNARKIDGGKQFFSTADDFGFSKHPREAFEKWNKASLLEQMVYLIRKEQPDVIINRFDHRTEGTTHGHHTASAQLSKEAFALAQDDSYKITSDEKLNIWNPKRLFFNASWFFFGSKQAFEKADKSKYIPLNIGVFYNQLGKNNQEIASLSRSQHQSQGFGDLSSRGEQIDYVELIDGMPLSSSNLFEGIDTSWNRIEGGKNIEPLVQQLLEEYDFKDPAKSIEQLTKIYTEIEKLPETIWKTRKQNEVKELIKNCAGLFLDFTTDVPCSIPNTPVVIQAEIANRSSHNVILKDVTVNSQKIMINKPLMDQGVFYGDFNTRFTRDDLTDFKFIDTFYDFKNQFNQNNGNEIGLEINGIYISFPVQIQYHYKDVAKGEIYKPFNVVPKVSVQFKQSVYISNSNQNLVIDLMLTNYSNATVNGELLLLNQAQKEVYKTAISLKRNEKNKEICIQKTIADGIYQVHFKEVGNTFANEVKWISYDHIPETFYLKPAQTKIVNFDNSKLKKQRIGYIMGAGDEIPQVLENVGYQVDFINLETLKDGELSQYETIIVGIRAFNTEKALAEKKRFLFDYAQNGGTVIVQYQTDANLQTEGIAPYSIKIGKTRVTDENAEVQFVNSGAAVLNEPFKITSQNFTNWVHEQGLYYAEEFADEFKPVLSSHDFDKKNTNGALIMAAYGKGYYVYTGLSFFRQLPVGNMGALELFVNLIELKK
ncbi:PIG-L family deacetylase [Myroides indicus]|uniref:GlcNAc-PI de-N-acetylase n=1 Tax=Myroides indicus TaxID=1323422 RepID=A0A4R7F1A3_9FLAO|nr:PIG-L family deacetylase [Myroides indicus]TDS63653.1 GlcNAc-PI de-N-acetylase [Myroides indicus]